MVPLISTLYKSPQHQLSLFPACGVFVSRSLATAFNSRDSLSSRAHALLSEPPMQNSTHSTIGLSLLSLPCRVQLNSLLQTVLLITCRHGPCRTHPVFTVSLLILAYSFSRERVYRAVAQMRSLYIRILHSNGCTCYNIILR
jgi:hypothetical protein